MHRDRGRSDYDNLYASDTSGYLDPRQEAFRRKLGGTQEESRWREDERWEPSSLTTSRGPSRPSTGAGSHHGRGAWNSEDWRGDVRDDTYGTRRRYDNEYMHAQSDDDETSGYAQGYAGYGQGQGDDGPRWRQRHRNAARYGGEGASSHRDRNSTYGPYRGRGPQDYRRSDERIREDVSEAMMLDPWLDASGLQVSVQDGVVTLEGTVGERYMKYLAEDCAAHAIGVRDVENRIRLDRQVEPDRDALGTMPPSLSRGEPRDL